MNINKELSLFIVIIFVILLISFFSIKITGKITAVQYTPKDYQTIQRITSTSPSQTDAKTATTTTPPFSREKRTNDNQDKVYTTKKKETAVRSPIQEAALKKSMQTQKMMRENMQFTDKALPVVVASHMLYPPDAKLTITINAEAYDNREVDVIKIYVDSELKQTCQIKAESGTCVFAETFQKAGSHSYFVEAFDSSQNKGLYPKRGTVSFKVGLEQNKPIVKVAIDRSGGKNRIIANAKDDTKVANVRIITGDAYGIVGPQVIKKECVINEPEGECVYLLEEYAEREYNYYYKAEAEDIWGNHGSSGWKMTKG